MEYNEIKKLDKMLKEKGIPHYTRRLMDGMQIQYYGTETYITKNTPEICSAIECMGSYGVSIGAGSIEISGLLTEEESKDDSVAGFLTAEEVCNRISKDYENRLELKKENEYHPPVEKKITVADVQKKYNEIKVSGYAKILSHESAVINKEYDNSFNKPLSLAQSTLNENEIIAGDTIQFIKDIAEASEFLKEPSLTDEQRNTLQKSITKAISETKTADSTFAAILYPDEDRSNGTRTLQGAIHNELYRARNSINAFIQEYYKSSPVQADKILEGSIYSQMRAVNDLNVKTTNNAIIALKYETNCQKAEKFLDLIEPYATKSQKEMLTKAIDEKRDYVADIVRKDGKVFSDIIKHYIEGGSDFVMKYSFANEPAAISALTELGKQKAGRYR